MTRNLIGCPLPKRISGSEDRPSSQVETRSDTPDRLVLTSRTNANKHLRKHRETSTLIRVLISRGYIKLYFTYLLLPRDTSSRGSQPDGDGAASAVSQHVASRRRIADVGRRRGGTDGRRRKY